MAVSGVEAQIADALLWKVGQMALSPALPVAWPNVPFLPKTGSPYLTVDIRPNTTDAIGIDFASTLDRQGLMQLSVFWPSGGGLVAPMQAAAQIAAAFKFGTRIDRNGVSLFVSQAPRVASVLTETDWLQAPVIISWRSLMRAAA